MSDAVIIEPSGQESFLDDYPEGLGGHVEQFDPEFGISGWALDINAPEQVLTIEMVADDQVVARSKTGIARPDVTAGRFPGAMPGFRFGEAEISRLAAIARFCMDHEITFRISGTQAPLAYTGEISTLGEMFPNPQPAAGGVNPALQDLSQRLAEHQRAAAGLTTQLWRPAPEQLLGYIEAMSTDAGGHVWLSGWIRPAAALDCAAIIVSLQTSPAGFGFAYFDRGDLPAGCFGFVGVLQTSWRPVQGYEVHIYLDRDARFLHGTPAMRVVPFSEFGENMVPLLSACHAGHATAMQRMLSPQDSWQLSNPIGFGVNVSVDKILVLPGFGALVSGWVVSPLREVSDFVLRLGSAVLSCDSESLYYKARPDLAEAFPGNENAWRKAGFVAAFRGKVGPDELRNPVLKLVYDDGGSSNHALDRQALRRLAEDGGLEEARHLFPALASELFFGEFASALLKHLKERPLECWPYAVAPAKQVLVFVIPDDASDLFLLLTSIDQILRAQVKPPAVAFVGSPRANRTTLVALFNALRAGSTVKYSLFWMHDPVYALYGLTQVLAELGAVSFAFIGAGIFLTEAGWRAALNSFPQTQSVLHLLEIEDPASPERLPELSARAFAWSSLAGALWLQQMPFFLCGFHADNGIGGATDDIRVHRNAARSARLPPSNKLVAAVNELALVA